jgi:hypothetical protein
LRITTNYEHAITDPGRADAGDAGAADRQKIIYQETGQGVAPSDKVTLSWFWENRFRPMRESRWEAPTRDTNLRDFAHYIEPNLGSKPLSEFNKFVLTTRLNGLAAANFSKPVVQ